MIDWFRGEIEFLHDPLPAGRVLSIDSDGSIAWECIQSIQCRSSHETTIKIRSTGGNGEGRATTLSIDGNLCKFLQGHNIFGSRNLNKLLLLTFRQIIEHHHEHFSHTSSPALTEAKIKKGDYKVKMLDINALYDIGNDQSVESWLHAAHMRAKSRHGRSSRDKGTVYLGKSSRRWAFKFYNKHREILSQGKTHKLPEHLANQGLEQFIQGKLRAELRIFSKELEKLGITHGYHLTPDTLENLFQTYLGKIDMTTQTTLLDQKLLDMPNTIRGTYELWKQGVNLRDMLSIRTFYRHRQILLEYGIDINMPCLAPEHNNVVPLIRIIEAKPVSIPQWAYEKGLIAA